MSGHKSNGKGIEDQILLVLKVVSTLVKICLMGFRKIDLKKSDTWFIGCNFALFIAAALLIWQRFFGFDFGFIRNNGVKIILEIFVGWPFVDQLIAIYGVSFFGGVFFLGFIELRRIKYYQLAIIKTGLKNGLGQVPVVKSIETFQDNRIKLLIESNGLGVNSFESKKDNLTASFRKTIESIEYAEDKGKVIIYLIERELPKLIEFHNLIAKQKGEYQFVIGQSLKGPQFQKIQTLPHLLISGATGGGKSIFFRSTMLSLLKSSPHIQLYLLDMKRGVEVKEFEQLPNVHTAKTEAEAVTVLEFLEREMNRRYEILEKSNRKSVDPNRDSLDLIIVGVDEAASLFGKNANPIAKKCIDELARLARASGIHLVLATQKPVKDAIDTGTLDNLTGRMTFRMISSAASNVAMGGNLAKKLPPVKGRAIWVNGNEYFEVQAPYISEQDLENEISVIKNEFETKKRGNKQQMIMSKSETKNLEVEFE